MPGESFSFGDKRVEHLPSISVVLLYMMGQCQTTFFRHQKKHTHPSARILSLASLGPDSSAFSIWRETLTPEAGFPCDESNTAMVVISSRSLGS